MSTFIDKEVERILKSALSPEDTDLLQISMELAKEAAEFQVDDPKQSQTTQSSQESVSVQKVLESLKKKGLIKTAQEEAAAAQAVADALAEDLSATNKPEDPSMSKHVNPAVTTPNNADDPIPPNKTDVTPEGAPAEMLSDVIGQLGTQQDPVKALGGEVDVTVKAPSEDVMVKKIKELLVALGIPEDIAEEAATKAGKSILTELSRDKASAETGAAQDLPSSPEEIKDTAQAIGEALDQMEAAVLSPVEQALESEPSPEDLEKVASLIFGQYINPYFYY